MECELINSLEMKLSVTIITLKQLSFLVAYTAMKCKFWGVKQIKGKKYACDHKLEVLKLEMWYSKGA